MLYLCFTLILREVKDVCVHFLAHAILLGNFRHVRPTHPLEQALHLIVRRDDAESVVLRLKVCNPVTQQQPAEASLAKAAYYKQVAQLWWLVRMEAENGVGGFAVHVADRLSPLKQQQNMQWF
mmetsp:Transcript_23258/g.38453  ORF Transcript_23258/g.38453 Transcript_23258/m.38453 type:complete len:123 (-) Transcript_23258:175-543(-)